MGMVNNIIKAIGPIRMLYIEKQSSLPIEEALTKNKYNKYSKLPWIKYWQIKNNNTNMENAIMPT